MQCGLSYEHLSIHPSVCPSVCLSVRLSNARIVTKRKHLAEKVKSWSRKSATSFPVSLRWTAYVARKPKRGLKMQSGHFSSKSWLLSKKVCYKVFFYVKTFSGKVVRHSLAGVAEWCVLTFGSRTPAEHRHSVQTAVVVAGCQTHQLVLNCSSRPYWPPVLESRSVRTPPICNWQSPVLRQVWSLVHCFSVPVDWCYITC